MARWYQPTSKDKARWRKFLATRAPAVRAVGRAVSPMGIVPHEIDRSARPGAGYHREPCDW
jgi:hypothetical protein